MTAGINCIFARDVTKDVNINPKSIKVTNEMLVEFSNGFFSFVGKLFVPKCQNHFQIHNRIFSYEKFVFRLFECEQRFIRDSVVDDTKKLPRMEQVKKYICTKIASHAIEEDFFFKK